MGSQNEDMPGVSTTQRERAEEGLERAGPCTCQVDAKRLKAFANARPSSGRIERLLHPRLIAYTELENEGVLERVIVQDKLADIIEELLSEDPLEAERFQQRVIDGYRQIYGDHILTHYLGCMGEEFRKLPRTIIPTIAGAIVSSVILAGVVYGCVAIGLPSIL